MIKFENDEKYISQSHSATVTFLGGKVQVVGYGDDDILAAAELHRILSKMSLEVELTKGELLKMFGDRE